MAVKITKSIILALLIFCSFNTVNAQSDTGFGVRVGNVSGLSIKTWTTPTVSVDALASWRYEEFLFFEFSYHYHWLGFVDQQPFFIVANPGIFAGRSYGKAGQLQFRFDNFMGGGVIRTGLIIPLEKIEWGLQYGFRVVVAPELYGEPTLDLTLHYFL